MELSFELHAPVALPPEKKPPVAQVSLDSNSLSEDCGEQKYLAQPELEPILPACSMSPYRLNSSTIKTKLRGLSPRVNYTDRATNA
jgi:hypothetical protein